MDAEVKKLREALELARSYATEHMQELAREFLDWNDSAVLCDGHFRELARLCVGFGAEWHASLRVAEGLLTRAMAQVIAKAAPSVFVSHEASSADDGKDGSNFC